MEFPLLNLNEMARVLRVSPKTVYYWVTRNEIPDLRVGRHLRFKGQEVIDFFESQSQRNASSCQDTQVSVNNSFSRSLKKWETGSRNFAPGKEQSNGN